MYKSEVERYLEGVTRWTKRVEEIEAELAAAEVRRTGYANGLAKLIEDGSSTESHILDLLARQCGPIDEDTQARYVAAEERLLKDKRGQLMMIIYSVKFRERYGGPSDGDTYRHENRFRIGVIGAEKLIWVQGVGITVPIERLLEGHLVPFESLHSILVSKKNMFAMDHESLVPLNFSRAAGVDKSQTIPFPILSGDEEVKKFLRGQGSEGSFESICAALNKLVLTAPVE